jgi:hypothetical protein
MSLNFLDGLGAFAKENGVALLCLIFLSLAIWRAISWTANKIILPIVGDIRHLFGVAETVFVAMGHDVADLKTQGCGRFRSDQQTKPPESPPTLQLTAAH